jgi:hypothetical protein
MLVKTNTHIHTNMNTHYETVLYYCKLFTNNYFIKNYISPYKTNIKTQMPWSFIKHLHASASYVPVMHNWKRKQHPRA